MRPHLPESMVLCISYVQLMRRPTESQSLRPIEASFLEASIPQCGPISANLVQEIAIDVCDDNSAGMR